MRRATQALLALAAWALLPGTAAADEGLVLTAEAGESYTYLSPWSQGEPSTDLGLRFFVIERDVDLGAAVRMSRTWGGDLVNAGQVTLDFTLRVHDTFYGGDAFEPFILFACEYTNLWAEAPGVPGPPAVPAGWTTRNGVGLRVGGGFMVTADEFYFDFTVFGVGDLLWPEPTFRAGGGASVAMGVYIE